jgi:hypothetical protein
MGALQASKVYLAAIASSGGITAGFIKRQEITSGKLERGVQVRGYWAP